MRKDMVNSYLFQCSTMSISLINSRTSVPKKELRENWFHLITQNRMGLWKERTEQLWVHHEWCYMIRAYRCIYERRHATQWYFFRTIVLIEYLAWAHERRDFLVRNLLFHILNFLAHLSSSMWPIILGRS